ncbi:MAG: hypothetical protein Q4C55_08350, partial [Eubacterium sp.]|nr:hypothetical protein [Eubacterium sp.]
ESCMKFFQGDRCNATLGGVCYIHLTMEAKYLYENKKLFVSSAERYSFYHDLLKKSMLIFSENAIMMGV